MAFKFIVPFCALLALVNAGVIVAPVQPVLTKIVTPSIDAVASTHQNVVRTFGGTVSTYSKSVHTPYSSVHKVDSRTTNNVYTPAIAKTVTYAAPVVTKTLIAPVPTVAAYTKVVAPVVAKTVYSSAVAPVVYSHAAPAVISHVSAPVVVKHAIAYSSAPAVAHVTFNGFGGHWAY